MFERNEYIISCKIKMGEPESIEGGTVYILLEILRDGEKQFLRTIFNIF